MAQSIPVPEGFGDATDCLALSPSGSRLAMFARERPDYRAGTLVVHDTADGQLLGGPEKVGDCRGIVFTDDATLVLASGSHCSRWALPGRPERLASFRGPVLSELTVHPPSSLFAVAMSELPTNVVVGDLVSGQRRFVAQVPFDLDVRAFAFSPDGRLLAAALGTEAILIWDVATAKRLRMRPRNHHCESGLRL